MGQIGPKKITEYPFPQVAADLALIVTGTGDPGVPELSRTETKQLRGSESRGSSLLSGSGRSLTATSI